MHSSIVSEAITMIMGFRNRVEHRGRDDVPLETQQGGWRGDSELFTTFLKMVSWILCTCGIGRPRTPTDEERQIMRV